MRFVAKSQFSIIYQKVPVLLRQMRENAGLTQREFAKSIGKTQSWVFKSESASRRIDIAEFLEWCLGCGVDPKDAFAELVKMRR
jgi:transcriptional regulator with XRE-family HTH domain